MKLKNLFLASVAFAGLFSACSKEDSPAIEGTNGESSYVQVGFSFPSAMGTRAASTEDGLATEQSFSTIALVIADNSNKVVDYITVAAKDFSPEGTGDKLYVSKNPIRATKQENAKVYVFVNPTSTIATTFAVGSTITGKEVLARATEQTGGIAAANGFLMTNTKGAAVASDIKGTKAAPTAVTVKVDRVSAKLVENSVKTAFDIVKEDHNINTDKALKITLTDYTYTNLNKSSYLLQNFDGAYTVDLNFTAPYGSNDEFFFPNTPANTEVAGYNFQPMSKGKIDYCLENTTTAAEQMSDKTTGVIYKAVASWDGKASTFYLYKNMVYVTWADLTSVYNKEHSGAPLTTEANYNFDQLKTLGITKYLDGVCYYRTAIQHELTASETLEPMEFAIVRNNVYKLNVNTIKSLGDPFIPTNPDPDKNKDTYIRLSVEVLPWTVRDNNFDF